MAAEERKPTAKTKKYTPELEVEEGEGNVLSCPAKRGEGEGKTAGGEIKGKGCEAKKKRGGHKAHRRPRAIRSISVPHCDR